MLPHTKRLRDLFTDRASLHMKLRNISDADVRANYKRVVNEGLVYDLAIDAVGADHALSRMKEWATLEERLAVRGAANVSMEDFLAVCLAIAPKYTASKLEKMRAALVWRQLEELAPAARWSRDELFKVRFKGALKSCKPFATRGAITEEKLRKLVSWLEARDEHMYARGFVITFYGMLRHSDLLRLRRADVEFGVKEVLLSIIGGKGRTREHVDVVQATEAEATLRVAMEVSAGELRMFPLWNKDHANSLIREFASLESWDATQGWTVHSLRHGFAQHLKRLGVSLEVRMQRGRWSSARVAEWYARGG